MVSIPRDYTSNLDFASICTKEEPITGETMDFTPEDEDKVIREAVSQKLDIPLVNPSEKLWRDPTKTKAST